MSSLATDLAFWLFALGAIGFALRVFRAASMVRASLSLLGSFVCVGGILLLLLAEYLGVALWFMMALEMAVMTLFMVAFMMNPAGLNPMQMVHRHGSAKLVGAAGVIALGVVGLWGHFPERPAGAGASLRALGSELLGDSMLTFESAGLALFATMIGAVVLSARSSRYPGAADAGSHAPPLDPDDPSSVPDSVEPSKSKAHGGHGSAAGSEHGG